MAAMICCVVQTGQICYPCTELKQRIKALTPGTAGDL